MSGYPSIGSIQRESCQVFFREFSEHPAIAATHSIPSSPPKGKCIGFLTNFSDSPPCIALKIILWVIGCGIFTYCLARTYDRYKEPSLSQRSAHQIEKEKNSIVKDTLRASIQLDKKSIVPKELINISSRIEKIIRCFYALKYIIPYDIACVKKIIDDEIDQIYDPALRSEYLEFSKRLIQALENPTSVKELKDLLSEHDRFCSRIVVQGVDLLSEKASEIAIRLHPKDHQAQLEKQKFILSFCHQGGCAELLKEFGKEIFKTDVIIQDVMGSILFLRGIEIGNNQENSYAFCVSLNEKTQSISYKIGIALSSLNEDLCQVTRELLIDLKTKKITSRVAKGE